MAKAWFQALRSINLVLQAIFARLEILLCVPQALFGGFGSALTYTGHNHVYIAHPSLAMRLLGFAV